MDMRATLKSSLSLGLVVAALTGCAGDSGAYPSLAMRPFETGTAPIASDPVPSPEANRPEVSPAMLAQLRAAADTSHAAYLSGEAAAERLARAARGLSFESQPRAAALVALADLDAQRGATAGTLARIDTLVAEAGGALVADPALCATQTEVAALLAREDAGIARLWAVMGT